MDKSHTHTKPLIKIDYRAIAEKCECSPKYVKLIARGERRVKTDKAKAVYSEIEIIRNLISA